MEWCTDFCLSCDQQTNGSAAYCSQACRLADLDRVHASNSLEPSSPLSTTSRYLSNSRNSSPTTSAFALPAAFDFAPYRSSPATFSQPPVDALKRVSMQRSLTSPVVNTTTSSHGQLRSSPSGTSLASLQSTQSTRSSMSQQSKQDLYAYANSFDQIRDLKRRKSLSP